MAFDTEMNQVAPETAAAGISEQSDVNAADLYTPEVNGASDQPQQPQTDASNAQTDDRRYTSDDMSKAVQNRLKQERKKAAYVLGEELLRERMQADNVTEAEALARIREDRIKAKAAAFKADPEAGFAELMRQRMNPGEEAQTPETRVESLYNAMTADIQSGKVPQGFDLNAHMSDRERAKDFIDLYEAFGMERACAIAMRMSPPAQPTKAEMNRSLPQPERTNNSYNPQPVDFSAMDSKQFAEYKERIRKANSQGKRVIF